jgi:hypothetical protein
MSDDTADSDIEWAWEAAQYMGMGRKADVVALLEARAEEAESAGEWWSPKRAAELRQKANQLKDKNP